MGGSSGPSALVAEMTEAEFAVRRHRDRLDANAQLGVPAHITVLFPLMSAADLTPTTLAHLGRLLASKPSFSVDLTNTIWWMTSSSPTPPCIMPRSRVPLSKR